MVTEFGPRGYWEPKFSHVMQGRIWEDEDDNKAYYYADQWKKIIYPTKGHNLGGIAYCWKERMEGSSTWFGVTDHEGNKKPAYYALKNCFNHKDVLDGCSLRKVLLTCTSRDKDGKYLFQAKVIGDRKHKLKYEWSINREEYLESVDYIEFTDRPDQIKLTLPENSSYYRLYLHVRDDDGNVVTASYPVTVNK
jgi:hypothetical protein